MKQIGKYNFVFYHCIKDELKIVLNVLSPLIMVNYERTQVVEACKD
jgi:hypothetical protein